MSNVSKHRRPVITYVSSVHDACKEFPSKDVSITKEVVRTFEDISPMLWEDNYGYVIEEHNAGKIIKVWRKHASTLLRRIGNENRVGGFQREHGKIDLKPLHIVSSLF